ncbi:MAG: AMP-binding protein [Synechococcaceae cyanobacterium]|nr:AMP-binding protein [Synechococcaceae cyanobacterium]
MTKGGPDPTDGPATSLHPLAEADRRRIEGWQEGHRLPASRLGVHHRFERQAARTPEAVALIVQDSALSYSALNRRADRFARRLEALGLRPGGIVAVCLERSVDLIVALLAILKAGGAYLALDPAWPMSP